jgi:hypothetical protein
MNCDCIETVDKKLADKNLALDTSIVFGKDMSTADAVLTISTHWKDSSKKKRGKKPTMLLVTFCPFCGTRAAKPVTGDDSETTTIR